MDESQASANSSSTKEIVFGALDGFRIEVPSWGFANTGTRFGKFVQPAAATTIEEKFADAAVTNRLTGESPTIALHVLWDLKNGLDDVPLLKSLEREHGVQCGLINPNLFQDQIYKFGSIASPTKEVRRAAVSHLLDCVEISKAPEAPDLSIWVADGSNYPRTQDMRKRIAFMGESLAEMYGSLTADQRMLIEYKPFEPAFYHTDIADRGMALHLAQKLGPQAKVLVDTGHHYEGTNIEQIVAWLLHVEALGGFHFNDRKYADDDLTLGSIDPSQVFRIFCEILASSSQQQESIAFMIDQSHNLKGKIEAMLETVCTAQELYAKAALVDRVRLAQLQDECRLIEAEELFRGAFWQDVRPVVREWREARGLPTSPLKALAESGYVEQITRERATLGAAMVSSYA